VGTRKECMMNHGSVQGNDSHKCLTSVYGWWVAVRSTSLQRSCDSCYLVQSLLNLLADLRSMASTAELYRGESEGHAFSSQASLASTAEFQARHGGCCVGRLRCRPTLLALCLCKRTLLDNTSSKRSFVSTAWFRGTVSPSATV
jgi:hypothetical protein